MATESGVDGQGPVERSPRAGDVVGRDLKPMDAQQAGRAVGHEHRDALERRRCFRQIAARQLGPAKRLQGLHVGQAAGAVLKPARGPECGLGPVGTEIEVDKAGLRTDGGGIAAPNAFKPADRRTKTAFVLGNRGQAKHGPCLAGVGVVDRKVVGLGGRRVSTGRFERRQV